MGWGGRKEGRRRRRRGHLVSMDGKVHRNRRRGDLRAVSGGGVVKKEERDASPDSGVRRDALL